MKRALIGHTGFIGSFLKRELGFAQEDKDDFLYRSTDINDIRGQNFDRVICAGAPGVKWLANKHPEEDKKSIDRLMDCLGEMKTKQLILISTVDVLPTPARGDELTEVHPDSTNPYGSHRKMLEEFCARNFACSIIRLPGMFGPGLKKNIIFDLMNRHEVHKIVPDSRYQFYDLKWLWGDLERMLARGIPLLHAATPPVTAATIARTCFGIELPPLPKDVSLADYDFRTRYSHEWTGPIGYLRTQEQVIHSIKEFTQ